MPSPRSRFETACRIGAFGLLGWLLGGSLIPPSGRRIERANGDELVSHLAEWTRAAANVGVHATLDAAPEPVTTEWLSALRRSGRQVTWSGNPPAAAMSVEPIADPNGGTRIDIAAPDGQRVAVRDDASAIDSIHVASGHLGGTVVTPIVVGDVRAALGNQTLAATAPDSVRIRPIVVLGAAGWEGKYVVSALEERGWPVMARFTVAPNVEVTQGTIAALDTAKISAVIAIDSTVASLGPSLERFVRSGGGLILAGGSASESNVRSLVAGSVSARTHPNVKLTDTIRLGTTGFYPVSRVTGDAVVLDKRNDGIAVAGRRVGAGRVIQAGYDDSWRWRMAGATGSEAAHREFWSRLVSAVAYAPSAGWQSANAAIAPTAFLVDQLGPARSASPEAPSKPVDRRILLTLMLILLLAEWTSRRLRGLR
jgi:hypothetical protein